MKKITFIIIASLLFVACSSEKGKPVGYKTSEPINSAYDNTKVSLTINEPK